MQSNLFRLGVIVFVLVISLGFVIGMVTALASPLYTEVEPNNNPATATDLLPNDVMSGTISPTGDVDYYQISGVNTLWGYTAILDTSASSSGKQGTLTAYGTDGTTVLQSDSGSWVGGSVLAWQYFVDGSSTHYIRVNETGNDDSLEPYLLRYYRVAIDDKPESEPNETLVSGTVTAKANRGVLSSTADVDCFSLDLHAGDELIIALNADPEGDGSPVDFALTLLDKNGAPLGNTNLGATGENEAIGPIVINEDGVHAYCVSFAGGTTGPSATYLAGPLVNAYNYFPDYIIAPVWLDPGPAGFAIPGDTLSFRMVFSNTSALPIPAPVSIYGKIDETCLQMIAAPGATYTTTTEALWQPGEIDPGSAFTATLTARATASCQDSTMHQSVSLHYYGLGTGGDAAYTIGTSIYLPAVSR